MYVQKKSYQTDFEKKIVYVKNGHFRPKFGIKMAAKAIKSIQSRKVQKKRLEMWSIGRPCQNFRKIHQAVFELSLYTAHGARRTAHGGRKVMAIVRWPTAKGLIKNHSTNTLPANSLQNLL